MTSAPPVVVDTSVAVKWFFDEPYSTQALTLLDTFREGTVRPLAPDLIYPEFANAVWKRVGRDRLSPEDGTAIIATFLALPFEITSSSSLLVPAYRLAVEHRRSVYDALLPWALGPEPRWSRPMNCSTRQCTPISRTSGGLATGLRGPSSRPRELPPAFPRRTGPGRYLQHLQIRPRFPPFPAQAGMSSSGP